LQVFPASLQHFYTNARLPFVCSLSVLYLFFVCSLSACSAFIGAGKEMHLHAAELDRLQALCYSAVCPAVKMQKNLKLCRSALT
jgi:hypothetical protein